MSEANAGGAVLILILWVALIWGLAYLSKKSGGSQGHYNQGSNVGGYWGAPPGQNLLSHSLNANGKSYKIRSSWDGKPAYKPYKRPKPGPVHIEVVQCTSEEENHGSKHTKSRDSS